MRAVRKSTEQQIQQAIFAHYRLRAMPGTMLWHCPNGGYRRRTEAAILKSLGVLPGAADIMGVCNGMFHAIELKSPGRRPTDLQLKYIKAVQFAGGYATWTDSLDGALTILEVWGFLKPNAAHLRMQPHIESMPA